MAHKELNISLPLEALLEQRHSATPLSNVAPGNGPWPGPHRGLKHGQGLDFDDLRQYIPGDDTRHIDWKVTARRNTTYTRLYREEKERLLTVALDFRSSMFTGSQTLSAVTAGLLAAKVIWQAADLSNRCNLTIQTDQQLHTLPPATGITTALNACKLIADTFDYAIKKRDANAQTDLKPLLEHLLANGRFTGSVVLISAGDELGTAFDQLMPVLSQSATIAWVLVEDPMEWQPMPTGRYGYRFKHNDEFVRIDTASATQLTNVLAQYKLELLDRLQQAGARTVSIRDGMSEVVRHLYQWQILA